MPKEKPSKKVLKALRKYYASCLEHLVRAAEKYPKDSDLYCLLMGHGLSKKEKETIIEYVRHKSTK